MENWDGRAEVRTRLSAALQSVARGQAGVLLVEGEVGAGCGLVFADAPDLADAHVVQLSAARADQLTRWTPSAVLVSALGEAVWSADIAELMRVIAGRAETGPLLIALDDLQWADPVTLSALGTLPSALRDRPVLWLLGRRYGVGDATSAERLFDHLESGGATRLRLEPLSDSAVERMVRDFAGTTPDGDLSMLVAGAGGSPALLLSLFAGLREEHGVARGEGPAVWSPRRLPGKVVSAVNRMLAGYSADTVSVLEVAAMFGGAFRVADVADVLGRTAGDILRAVRVALRAGLLAPGDPADCLLFRHGLVGRVLREAVTPSVAAALHRQIGMLLLRRNGSAVAAAADHLVRGALPGDTQAITALADAAAQALDTAPAASAEISLRALRLAEHGSPDHRRLVDLRVTALLRVGRVNEAEELASAGLTGEVPQEHGAQLGAALATARVLTGRYSAAVTMAERVLADQANAGDHDRASAMRLLALTANGDDRQACRLAEEAVADDNDRSVLAGTARMVLAFGRWADGDVTAFFDLLRQALRSTRGVWRDVPTPHPQLVLATGLAAIGDLRGAQQEFAEAERVVEHVNDLGNDLALRIGSAWVRARAGRIAEAAEVAEAAVELSEELGVTWWTPLLTTVMATGALRQGDLTAARLHLDRTPETRLPLARAQYAWVALQLEAARTSAVEALSVLAASHADLLDRPAALLLEPAAAAWLVRGAVLADDRDLVRMVVAASAELARRNPAFPTLAASAAHARGVARRDAASLTAALGQYADPWSQASAAEDLAAVDASGAVAALERAMSGYGAAGAVRDVARIRSKLREAGVRRRHWSYADRPSTGWESLTDTEREVAELVSGGLTNRQVAARMFVSPHTVHAHLGRIFRKLGITSRVELTGLRHRIA